jgi:alpha-galactosidase
MDLVECIQGVFEIKRNRNTKRITQELSTMKMESPLVSIVLNENGQSLWTYMDKKSGMKGAILFPTFEVDGNEIFISVKEFTPLGKPIVQRNGAVEHRWQGTVKQAPGITIEMIFRIADDSPIVRFKYALKSDHPIKLTKSKEHDAITYASLSFSNFSLAKEIRLSEFNELTHSYCPGEYVVDERHFANSQSLMGPILAGQGDQTSLIIAYEHGSQVPDAFISFGLSPDRTVKIQAVKGNYHAGRIIDTDHPFETIWFQFGMAEGTVDDMAKAYRHFILHRFSNNVKSRKPYIYYNTWNFQERDKYWNGKSTNERFDTNHLLKDIEFAHRIGIDVYVIDAGWSNKAGDWTIDEKRFPDRLKDIKALLDKYNMKLGLWFNPTHASIQSDLYKKHADDEVQWKGQGRDNQHDTRRLCLATSYADSFANALIRLHHETGAVYFKLDGVEQHTCDSPDHGHGTMDNSEQERDDCAAFAIASAMIRINEKVGESCPDIIIDFDVTEACRNFGLGFLSGGKYFLHNNGPYFGNFYHKTGEDGNWNLFFNPGPARPWICRSGIEFDKWIPSVLFLSHFFADDSPAEGWTIPFWTVHKADPDDGSESQMANIASVLLGANGIWGDLSTISDKGIDRISTILNLYKQVRDDITESTVLRYGTRGSSPEIYEKINPQTGKGMVVMFANQRGEYSYITNAAVDKNTWKSQGTDVAFVNQGKVHVSSAFSKPGARIVFFGVSK